MTVMCITTTIVLLPLAMTRLPSRIPNLEVIVSLLVLSIICTALAYLLYFSLVAEVGASRGTVITYVNPPIAVVLGLIFLGEPLDPALMLGCLLILVG